MTTDVMSTPISVLCDYDALYAAIELKLSALPHVHVIRLESNPVDRPENGQPMRNLAGEIARNPALIIVASIPPINDPMSLLSRTSLRDQVGQAPVLVISEQPSRPESDDRITYLNFPFDMDDLTQTAMEILNRRPQDVAGQEIMLCPKS